jgi:hypothetical protein
MQAPDKPYVAMTLARWTWRELFCRSRSYKCVHMVACLKAQGQHARLVCHLRSLYTRIQKNYAQRGVADPLRSFTTARGFSTAWASP